MLERAAMTKTEITPDKDALKRVGASVRSRLEADPKAYKIPTDKAEIFAVGKFLTGTECTRLMRMIDVVAQPSKLFDQDYSNGIRTSYSGNFDARDPFVQGISRRIDDLLGMKPECGETIQGQRYLPGQEFKPHNDWFYTDQDGVPQPGRQGRRNPLHRSGYQHRPAARRIADVEQCATRWPPQSGHDARRNAGDRGHQICDYKVVSHPALEVGLAISGPAPLQSGRECSRSRTGQ